jgi:DTW domain-containing protein YfiP
MDGTSGASQEGSQGPARTARAEPRARCLRCAKPESHCVCARIPRVSNRTPVFILQHPRERFHPIGTARIARLGLARSALLVPRAAAARSLAVALEPPPGTALLFPSAGARDLATLAPAERPSGLIVLDGTWSQAGKLYRANAWLGALPHVALSPAAPTRYRIRRAPRPGFISTIEAIVAALALIEPATPGLAELLAAFDAMIDAQLAFRHRAPRRPLRKLRRRAQHEAERG